MAIQTEAGIIVEKKLKQIGEEALQRAEKLLAGDSKGLDNALWQVGDKLERGALSRHKHNDPWAIKSVVREGIRSGGSYEEIKEQIRHEISEELTEEQLAEFPMEQVLGWLEETIEEFFIGVTRLWQKETFDPLLSFKKKMKVEGKSKGTIKESLCVAARFIGKNGRKRRYSDTEIMDFLYEEQERLSENSYCTKLALLKTFITSVEPQRAFPVKVKSYKGETFSPALSKDQVDALIVAGNIFLNDVDRLRLAVMTIYGARVGEVAQLSYKDIDLPAKTIRIPREKKGAVKAQPIPEFLMPVFAAAITPCAANSIHRKIKRWARLACFRLPKGVAVHAIRRRVVTELKEAGINTYDIYSFMCWSKHTFGMLPRYVKTAQEASDTKILENHPFVESWAKAEKIYPFVETEKAIPCVQKYNIPIPTK